MSDQTKPKPKAPARTRKKVNITLSAEARLAGEKMAKERGIKLSQLLEQMLRDKIKEEGIQVQPKSKKQ